MTCLTLSLDLIGMIKNMKILLFMAKPLVVQYIKNSSNYKPYVLAAGGGGGGGGGGGMKNLPGSMSTSKFIMLVISLLILSICSSITCLIVGSVKQLKI